MAHCRTGCNRLYRYLGMTLYTDRMSSRADQLKALIPHLLHLYWTAKTPEQESQAYRLLRALGLSPSYGEDE